MNLIKDYQNEASAIREFGFNQVSEKKQWTAPKIFFYPHYRLPDAGTDRGCRGNRNFIEDWADGSLILLAGG